MKKFNLLKNYIFDFAIQQRPFFYGLSEIGPASIDIFLKIYLLIYFNKVLNLPAELTSLAIGLGIFWDAIIDPYLGKISDRYFEKNKNRKNILLISLVFMCVSFFVLWRIQSHNYYLSIIFLFIGSAFLNSSISFFQIPLYSVAIDLEPDNEKRSQWIGWRLVFFNLGSLVGLLIPAYFLTYVKYQNVAGAYQDAVSIIVLMTFIVTWISIQIFYHKSQVVKNNPNELIIQSNNDIKNPQIYNRLSILDSIKDKHFLQMLISFFVVNCGIGLNSTLALYYYKNFLNYSEKQTQVILIAFLVIFTLSIPMWIWLANRFNKKNLIIFGAGSLGAVAMILFPNANYFSYNIIFMVASVLAGLLTGSIVVLEIYLAEYLKEKEFVLNTPISSQYIGFWKMSGKVSRAVAIGLAGPILNFSKLNNQYLANYFGWGVGIFFIVSAFIMSISISKKN
jgi:GPH family glycoside/pentoside/hexuronide:cation symporter